MNKVSYRVALGGVISSLCIFSMFVAGAVPFLYLTMPMIAGTLISIIAVEVNRSWAFLTYVSVSLLSIFVTSNKEASLIFILLFGYYPIIKEPIDKLRPWFLRILTKLVIFNIVAVADYYATLYVLGISDMTDDFAFFGKMGIYIFWGLCNIVFFIYDYALKGSIELYVRYLKPKIYH
ncbi:MAG: hypothetical protein NC320_10025 [Clostridium sp.]|nr:hypothetical protein [Clostridium sp.]MCM1547687.1 hypothetical protein [Ruminococcus sp.]